MGVTPAPPGHEDNARSLLYGLLALQNNFISRDSLVAAFGAWLADRSTPLDRILLDRGYMESDCHALLQGLVRQHLRLHGGVPEQSLGDLNPAGSVLRRLAELGDPGLLVSLGHVAETHRGGESGADSTATFLGTPTSSGARFRVLRLHAEGGLGKVYVARDEEVQREVALKQIKDEYAADAQSRARFVIEARITGGLEHPGIVPVYGLGTDDDGRPYYAMRFIGGESLKEAIARFHSDGETQGDAGRRTLALQKLLRRFLDVCDAIGYAHSRGVLHRDLKPGNILLGDFGETLVVDWGLAKAVGHHLEPAAREGAEGTLRPDSGSELQPTVTGQRMGTPGYMPPEQAAGRLDELGAPSDVYSLGATLYALLTGRAPFAERDLAALLRQVERGEFPRPRQVRASIDPALEGVCLKAMARRPQDRYPSPRALAEDIEHWLADEPVTAYRDPLATRARRWLRRHRGVMTATAAGLIAISLGLTAWAVMQWRYNARLEAANLAERQALDQSRRHFRLAMRAVDQFYTGVTAEVIEDRPDLAALGARLLEAPRQFYQELKDDLARGHDRSPATRVALADAWRRLARVTSDVGSKPDALEAHRQSVSLLQELLRREPDDPELLITLANERGDIGVLLHAMGRHAEALGELDRARVLLEQRVSAQPHQAGPRRDLAQILFSIAQSQRYSNQLTEALGSLEAARVQAERLPADGPEADEDRLLLADIDGQIGNLQRDLGHPEQALASYEASRTVKARLQAEHPRVPKFGRGLASVLTNIGLLQQDLGHFDDALKSHQRAEGLEAALAAEHPNIHLYQNDLSATLHFIGMCQGYLDRPDAAAAAYEKSRPIAERLVAEHPEVAQYTLDLGELYCHIGRLERDRGRLDAALEWYRRSAQTFEALLRREPNQGVARLYLRRVTVDRSEALSVLGRHTEALSEWERLQAIGEVAFHETYANSHAQILARAGRTDEALAEARSILRGQDSRLDAFGCYDLACVYSVAAGVIGRDHRQPPEERTRRVADLTEQAARLLQRARRGGYFTSSRRWHGLQSDPDLDSIRSQPWFEALRADLMFPIDPFPR